MLRSITVLLFSVVAMGRCDLSDFFKIAEGNLTRITWEHAVNNGTILNKTLTSNVMMLEADVSLGTAGNESVIPIMAHPPATTSDLTLQQFIASVIQFNSAQKNTDTQKGIKLDFKSIEAFRGSIPIINAAIKNITFPLLLNADILPGPVNATTQPLDANEFIASSKQFPNATLSLGWTTTYNKSLTNNSYTDQQIDSMIALIKNLNVTQQITFPVRAGLAAESVPQMQRLISGVGNSTLTIWSGNDDPVNIDNLRSLIFKIGLNKVYIDVPQEIYEKLNLGSVPSTATQSLFSVVLATVLLVLTSKIL